jgi:hypothetical protein
MSQNWKIRKKRKRGLDHKIYAAAVQPARDSQPRGPVSGRRKTFA